MDTSTSLSLQNNYSPFRSSSPNHLLDDVGGGGVPGAFSYSLSLIFRWRRGLIYLFSFICYNLSGVL
ncbi:uncharacterized protein P174DRAFT_153476 [Aspergillus novofumigatus IBT 16806]|uniref:Uncharacterized protein n=1 Tax=Aspergillus novofumigatus (strain IBT 16806) TaxID=1392255 RepID=A0A2I1CET6_ASPN1|nr:uncharacterized protein P174DRAFT_153476 [Aspergillus novofumigatus IBT 16806]PKX96135.1 hypothetical protein P174DRAFT_153476 [Aspergillus novofumigatus IBT 16806]